MTCCTESLSDTPVQNSTSMINIKIAFGDDIRRVKLKEVSLEALSSLISLTFKDDRVDSKRFVLKYKDDEDEFITIPSTVVLQEAFQLHLRKLTLPLFKVYIFLRPLHKLHQLSLPHTASDMGDTKSTVSNESKTDNTTSSRQAFLEAEIKRNEEETKEVLEALFSAMDPSILSSLPSASLTGLELIERGESPKTIISSMILSRAAMKSNITIQKLWLTGKLNKLFPFVTQAQKYLKEHPEMYPSIKSSLYKLMTCAPLLPLFFGMFKEILNHNQTDLLGSILTMFFPDMVLLSTAKKPLSSTTATNLGSSMDGKSSNMTSTRVAAHGDVLLDMIAAEQHRAAELYWASKKIVVDSVPLSSATTTSQAQPMITPSIVQPILSSSSVVQPTTSTITVTPIDSTRTLRLTIPSPLRNGDAPCDIQ
jgi:PB1 domain